MTIHLDSEVVATGFDPVTQTCSYTIQRGADRWTAQVPLADLTKLGANKAAKHVLIANLLNQAMLGPPDAPAVAPYGGESTDLEPKYWREMMDQVGGATYQPDGGHLIRIDEPIVVGERKYEPGVYRCG